MIFPAGALALEETRRVLAPFLTAYGHTSVLTVTTISTRPEDTSALTVVLCVADGPRLADTSALVVRL